MDSLPEYPVLILDDDYTSCKVVEHYLKTGGFKVEVYEHAADALTAIEAQHFSLIISDWFMPEINGESFLRQVRQFRPDTPVIFLTGNSDIENAVSMIRAGATDYLLKPVSQHELLFRVSRAMELHQSNQVIAQIKREKEILELENKQMINWRLMYASKESEQVRQIISLLARTINQSGGFMWLDLLQASTQESGTGHTIAAEVYDLIISAATQQRHIIELLTFINTIQTKDLDMESMKLPLFMDEVLNPAYSAAKAIAAKHKKDFTFHPGLVKDSPGLLKLDRQAFMEIIKELTVNGIKYSPPGSRLLLECRMEDRNQGNRVLAIHLRNSISGLGRSNKQGIGIPYELSEQVFELFYTLNAYPEQLPEETWSDGTGLYICRKLLQRMGAWIEAKNGLDYMTTPPEPFVQFVMMFPLEKE